MKDEKFNQLVLHINILMGIYAEREKTKAEFNSYGEAHECLIKRSVLENLLIEATKISKDEKV
jgi:hypothetical protein